MDADETASAWAALIGTRVANGRIVAFALREDAGEVHIGMIERAAYTGSIEYHACVESSPFWAIDNADIYLGSQVLKSKRIIFDTASQFIRGPEADVKGYYDRMKTLVLKSFHGDSGLYSIPCSTPSIQWVGIGLHRSRWIDPKQ